MSVLSLAILYISADIIGYLNTGVSFWLSVFTFSESVAEEMTKVFVFQSFKTAFDSVPFYDFLDNFLGGISTNVFTFIGDLQSGFFNLKSVSFDKLDFTRDLAKTAITSFVFFAIEHIKEKIKWKSIAVTLAVYLSSVFWIFASYTFAECILLFLEKFTVGKTMNAYIIVIVIFSALQTVITAFGDVKSVIIIALVVFIKLLLGIIRACFVCFIIQCILTSANLNPSPIEASWGFSFALFWIIAVTFLEKILTKDLANTNTSKLILGWKKIPSFFKSIFKIFTKK